MQFSWSDWYFIPKHNLACYNFFILNKKAINLKVREGFEKCKRDKMKMKWVPLQTDTFILFLFLPTPYQPNIAQISQQNLGKRWPGSKYEISRIQAAKRIRATTGIESCLSQKFFANVTIISPMGQTVSLFQWHFWLYFGELYLSGKSFCYAS